MTFDEIKQEYIRGASLDETLERLAVIDEEPMLEFSPDVGWYCWLSRGGYGPGRPTIREAMMAAFGAE